MSDAFKLDVSGESTYPNITTPDGDRFDFDSFADAEMAYKLIDRAHATASREGWVSVGEDLKSRLVDALESHRVSLCDEDNNHLCLSDVLTHPGARSIQSGLDEIECIVDTVLEVLDLPQPPKGGE